MPLTELFHQPDVYKRQSLTSTVVTTLYCIVEQTVNRVTIILIILSCIDTCLLYTSSQTADVHTRTGTHMLHIAQVSDVVVGIFYWLLLLRGCLLYTSRCV